MLWVSTHRGSSLTGQWSDPAVFVSSKNNIGDAKVEW